MKAIQVENLSKRYRIGSHKLDNNKNLTEAIMDAVKAPFNSLRQLRSLTKFSDQGNETDIF